MNKILKAYLYPDCSVFLLNTGSYIVSHDASVVLRTTEGHGLAHFTEAVVKNCMNMQ